MHWHSPTSNKSTLCFLPSCLALRVILAVFFLFLIFSPKLDAAAETGPAATVEAMLQKMKSQGNASPALDLYHWPSVYNEMNADERKVFGANTPDELKSSMQSFFDEPEKFFLERMKANVRDVPPEQMAMMDSLFQPMVKGIANKMDEANAQLKETEFKVTEKSVEGNKAVVEVHTKHPSEKSDSQELRMQRIDGRWYLLDTIKAGASPTADAS